MPGAVQATLHEKPKKRMSCWFLSSAVLLLLSSTNLIHARRHPWAPLLPTSNQKITKNHNNCFESDEYRQCISLSLSRILTLRAGDIPNDDVKDESTSNSRRKRRRKRVQKNQPSSVKGPRDDLLDYDDDDETAAAPTESVIVPATKKVKRKKRRRILFSPKDKDANQSLATEEQNDVVKTTSNETVKRKKRRRRKIAGDGNELDSEKKVEVESTSLNENNEVVEDLEAINSEDTTPDVSALENTEIPQATTRTKKRRRKKRVATSSASENIADIIEEQEMVEKDEVSDASPETPQQASDASVEIPSKEDTKSKKRKRRRRVTKKEVQDTPTDLAQTEGTVEVIDSSPLSIADGSDEIPCEEIVPESTGSESSVEVGESSTVLRIHDEKVDETVETLNDVEKESEPSLHGDTEIPPPTIDESVEITNENVAGALGSSIEIEHSSKDPMVGGDAEDPPSEEVFNHVEEEEEPSLIHENSITSIDDSDGTEKSGEIFVEHIDATQCEDKTGEDEVKEAKDINDTVLDSNGDDEESITFIDSVTGTENSEPISKSTDEILVEDERNEILGEAEDAKDDEEKVDISTKAPVDIQEEANADPDLSQPVENDFSVDEEEAVGILLDDEEEEDIKEETDIRPPAPVSDESVAATNESCDSLEETPVHEIDSKMTLEEDDDDDDDCSIETKEKDADEDCDSVEETPVHEMDSKMTLEEDDDDDDCSIETKEKEADEETVPLEVIDPSNPSSEMTTDVAIPQSNEEQDVEIEDFDSTQSDPNGTARITECKEETEPVETLQNSIELENMDDDCLTISVVTWNLAESSFSETEASFFKKFRKGKSKNGSDLVLIGAQECEDIKPRRTEGRRSRHLRRVGIQMLGKDYVPLAIHSLGGIQLALYCHRDVLGDVEMINIADVTCGVGNVFHNKGAIGVYLKLKRLSDKDNGVTKTSRILLTTGHLAAHVKNVDARNDDFKRIVRELEEQAPARFLRPKKSIDGSDCDGSHLLQSMDHVFFAGDLNYRVDLPREYVEQCITNIKENQSHGRFEEVDYLMNFLLRRDQLLQTIASGRAFPQFSEGKITFLPTFKFDKGTQNYDTSHKQRVPAWTDRILFRSNKVNVLEYQSVPSAMHSDHRPVFGTYQIGWGTTKDTSGRRKRGKRNRKL